MGDELSNNAPIAILGLGSNIGDRRGHLARGLHALEHAGAVKVEAVSSLYASEPVECEGGEFLNAAARVRLLVSPRELLAVIAKVQADAGRRGSKQDARPLDIDILYVDDMCLSEPGLIVPHPRRLERPFALVPAAEVHGDLRDPETKKPLRDEAERCYPTRALRRIAGPEWWNETRKQLLPKA